MTADTHSPPGRGSHFPTIRFDLGIEGEYTSRVLGLTIRVAWDGGYAAIKFVTFAEMQAAKEMLP